jgi:hypothetical protein
MTARQYEAALDVLGLSQAAAAKWLGISLRASHGYANGAKIPEPIAKLLRLPALADHEMGVADCLNRAAEILETANASVEKPTA